MVLPRMTATKVLALRFLPFPIPFATATKNSNRAPLKRVRFERTEKEGTMIARTGARIVVVALFAAIFLLAPIKGYAEPAKKEFKLNILSSRMGMSSYVACFALADLINKNSSWIRATAVETKGPNENISIIISDPAMRKNSIVFAPTEDIRRAMLGLPPYGAAISDLKVIGRYGSAGVFFWCTYDPKIKTPGDLKGKKIGLDSKLNAFYWVGGDVLKAWGLDPNKDVKLHAIGIKAINTALTDGTIDVAYYPAAMVVKDRLVPTPGFQELLSARPLFLPFGVEKRIVDEHNAKTQDWRVWGQIAAGAVRQDVPSEPMGVITTTFPWWVHVSMDEEVVYEVSRICVRQAADFGNYHASLKGMSAKTIADIPPLKNSDFHLGAMKYYREIGVK